MTAPTGPAAGVHLPWTEVPPAVKAWAAGVAGGVPGAVRDVAGGFSPGATAVLGGAERDIFVKAVGTALNPESPGLHRREVVVSAALPQSPRVPRFLDSYDDGDWVALAFEAVDGRPPRHPWEAGELALVTEALSSLHRDLTPSPVPSLTALADYARHLFGGWAALAAMDVPPAGLDEWVRSHLDRLAELESGWPAACEGPTLVHGDVRADNVLLTAGGVVFVDWPHAAVGTPAFDVIAWAPSVVLEGGPPPEELLGRHVSPIRVDSDAITVLLTAVAGFFVAHSLRPGPPGLPTLRAFQAAQGEVALAWLRRRTGW